MKKIFSALVAAAIPFILAATAYAGAPSPAEGIAEMFESTGVWVFIAGGAAVVALVVGIIVIATGKKK